MENPTESCAPKCPCSIKTPRTVSEQEMAIYELNTRAHHQAGRDFLWAKGYEAQHPYPTREGGAA
jgi:hypothetical protein